MTKRPQTLGSIFQPYYYACFTGGQPTPVAPGKPLFPKALLCQLPLKAYPIAVNCIPYTEPHFLPHYSVCCPEGQLEPVTPGNNSKPLCTNSPESTSNRSKLHHKQGVAFLAPQLYHLPWKPVGTRYKQVRPCHRTLPTISP